MIKEQIFAEIACKGGIAILMGIVVMESEKAVKIDYALEPVFAGSTSGVCVVNKTAWVPKSQVVKDQYNCLNIKSWFANKAMKSYNIKPYEI